MFVYRKYDLFYRTDRNRARLGCENVSFCGQESDEDDRKSTGIASTIHPKFGDPGLSHRYSVRD